MFYRTVSQKLEPQGRSIIYARYDGPASHTVISETAYHFLEKETAGVQPNFY
jgi:hypothetical protein